MKYAIVVPIQPVELGYRIAQVNDQPFEVALPLFWVQCDDEVVADMFWYDPSDQMIKVIPQSPEPVQSVVEGAQTL